MSGRSLFLAVLLLALAFWLYRLLPDSGADAADLVTDVPLDVLGLNSLYNVDVGDAMTKTGATLKDFAQAIYDFEDPNRNSIATRNNNPGNLKFAGQRGAVKDPNSDFALFPNFQSGFDALVRQLKLNVSRTPDQTLLQDRIHYLGGDPSKPPVVNGEGNPTTYAQFIAGRLGATVNTTLGQLFGGKA